MRGGVTDGQVKTRFINEWLCKHRLRRSISTVCELGFMSGHSAMLFLQSTEAKLISFDLGDSPWTRPAADIISAAYGNRFEFVIGLSNNTVHQYRADHPALSCDVLFVDGSKFPEQRLLDLHNFRRLAKSGSVLFYDEASSLPCVMGEVPETSRLCSGNEGAAIAYNRAAREGLVKVTECRWAITEDGKIRGGIPKKGHIGDGSCVAEYL
jgi:predicted O-methyltransferase YrrM